MSQTKTDQPKSEWLARSVLAADLTAEEISVLAEAMDVEQLAGQEDLVFEGDPRRTLFILVEGRLAVRHAGANADTIVYRMSPGECAGTRAFVDGSPRKAGLRAAGDCVLLTLEPEDFEALLSAHPMLVLKVMRALFRITHSNLMRANEESDALRNYVTRSHGRY